MPRKRNPHIPNQKPREVAAFIDLSAANAKVQVGNALDSIQPILRSTSTITPVSNTLNVRQGLSKFDYELFRPGERNLYHFRGIFEACLSAYERVSIIHNAIDSMGDFTAQGIKIVHPNPGIEKFYQNWWHHVNANHISERFSNLFYRTGNPIVRRNMAKVKTSILDDLKRGYAAFDDQYDNNLNSYDDFFHDYDQMPEKQEKPVKNLIPWEYDFLNPMFITLMGGDLALFSGQKQYGLEIPRNLINAIREPKTQLDVEMVSSIPDYIINPIRNGAQTIPLDPSRISVYHYKKDSWQQWAHPIIYSIMDEIIILQKLKMADLAALDGACSRICVWKLGNIEKQMFPTAEAIEKLSSILQHAGNGQRLDIIWGPDIDFKETASDFAQFLGKEKYVPTLEAIYAGLGIPPSLTGVGSHGAGQSNLFLSLKTLIERLNYGRDALTRFWTHEIKIVQKAMGFRTPAKVEFKNMILSDEAAQHQLLINLLDRDVISLERVREHFGYIPEVEEATIKKEYQARDSKKVPPKTSPFHDSHPDLTLEKIFAQTGAITPTQVGLELDPKATDEVTPLDLQIQNQKLQEDQFGHQKKIQTVQTKQQHELNLKKQKDETSIKKLNIKQGVVPDTPPPGQPGEGRPKNSVDTQPRKQRTTKATSDLITLQLWANAAQETISSIVNPVFLKMCNKKNVRSLTTSQVEEVEHLKWVILCNLKPETEITQATITNLMSTTFPANTEPDNYWRVCVASHVAKTGAAPTIDEIKQIQSYVYALFKGDYKNGQSDD